MALNFRLLTKISLVSTIFLGLIFWPEPSTSAVQQGRVGGGGGGGLTPWGRFKHRHVIKESRYPGHQQWTADQWNKYAKGQGLDGRNRNKNSFISVGRQSDIKNSFSVPGVGSRISHGRYFGSLQYRSKGYHNIYQLSRPGGRNSGPYNVQVYRGATFKAALDNQNRPVHFDSGSITDSLGLTGRPINRK